METKYLLSSKENKKRLMESINEVPKCLKWETINELATISREATMEMLYDVVDHTISESDVPLVDYDLHHEVMKATMLLLIDGLQTEYDLL